MNEADEIMDLVDENDQVIGQMSRKQIHDEDRRNYRSVNVFLVNDEGKIWTPRRTMKKRIAPGGLDFSVGGHVQAGQTYVDALKQEVDEELNMHLRDGDFIEMAHLSPEDGLHSFQKIYLIRSNKAPHYNLQDFTEYFWLSPEELVEKIEAGEKAKSDIVPVVKKVFLEE